MLDAAFYNLTQSLWNGFFTAMLAVRRAAGHEAAPPPPLLQVQPGMAESPGWFLVQAAEFDPSPLTVSGLRVRDVYASESIVAAWLEVMAAEKWFHRRRGAYHLTDEGRTLIEERQATRDHWMAVLDHHLQVDVARLDDLLSRVIEGSFNCEDPPGNWCLRHSRNRAPGPEAAHSVKLFQYVADINAFRDDAHMASWRPFGVDGYVWETLSFVAAGQATNADALFNRLSYRGYSPEDYSAALRELGEKGWLKDGKQGDYILEDAGKAVLTESERLTDLTFYAPWRLALSEAEIAEVRQLVVQLRDELQQLS